MIFSEHIAIYMAFILHQCSGSNRDKKLPTLWHKLGDVADSSLPVTLARFLSSFSSSRCTVYTVRSIFSVETGFRLSDDQCVLCQRNL